MLGMDCGTMNLVSCKRNDAGDLVFKEEVNAFIQIELKDEFTYNMMHKSKVPLILRDDQKVAYALGQAAVSMAYSMPGIELRRPMKDGCVNPKEKDAFEIMKIMIHSLLSNVTNDQELVYYCVPANAVNSETDAEYHQKLLEAIFKAYKSPAGLTVKARPINEGLALVYAELEADNYTGIGISCLCPGTKIYTEKGIVPIEAVCTGDKVITHTGRWQPITGVISKAFKGTMTKIQISGYSNTTSEYRFVDNHELYVKREGGWQWVGCEEVVVGDIVGEPIIKQNRDCSRPAINICERTTCSKKWNKRRIESSPDLQRLIGYFLGDGSLNITEGSIQIDFGLNEHNYVDDVHTIFDKFFGKKSSVSIKDENVLRIKCYSKGLTNWFSNHLYDKAGNKKYPWSIERLSNSECLNLLIGLVRSDGCIFEDQITFYNTNTKLILLAKQLFSRIGVGASVSHREPRTRYYAAGNRHIIGKQEEWTVGAAGIKVQRSLVEQFNTVDCDNSRTREQIFIEDGFCCGRIQVIDREEYDGEVYDLQVSEDHSFSGPFLTIHNCGAGMVNLSFTVFGAPMFNFAIVNSGDWIDRQVAKATGESITVCSKEKEKIDFTKPTTSMMERAILTQYNIMIDKTVAGIKKGLAQNVKARTGNPVKIVVAGGTSMPNGFEQLFRDVITNTPDIGIDIGEVVKPSDPLRAVARGCLTAAENANR